MAPLNEEELTTVGGGGRGRGRPGESELGPEAMVRYPFVRQQDFVYANPHTLSHSHSITLSLCHRFWMRRVEKCHSSIPFQKRVVWNRNRTKWNLNRAV